ncbi:hydroxymethylglutaryl-CoA lyase [Microbacterium sp. MEC084]|uniref:hydroxymethylglutaryl-CoA lyase n=1 Tax=unclassified Microbacterium TaxID=2609290 RepID=UPI0006F6C77B|nr:MULTISPECIES: hydroxymethylglutaryl-CoA lyase [unclassified Microbacterium]KQY97579.1 hydroxymethylglutaryl-CoA lyase [Microbacterium sp. Root53]MCD1268397.1 hydroxymethylglutaryl-CoA lyase [Microbacterium sp. MEC084]
MTLQYRDVTLRDGLQLAGKPLPTERKVRLVRELFALGLEHIEVGSMARPDLVPTLADTLDVIAALTPEERDRVWVWVATPRHVEKAAAAGARRFQYCFSASDSHNQANIGRDTETSLAAMPDAIAAAAEVGGSVQLCIATSFTCPFEGEVPIERFAGVLNDPRTAGAVDVVVCDTLGQAHPAEVRERVALAARERAGLGIVYHGHDTWGLGVANAAAAADGGATVVDGALGGLGGCPFAPGASGNTATEDLVFAFRPDWLTTESFGTLVHLGEEITGQLDEPNRSRSRSGARSRAKAFPWVVA